MKLSEPDRKKFNWKPFRSQTTMSMTAPQPHHGAVWGECWTVPVPIGVTVTISVTV
jgi:hypothetical protein